jgi:hypothetical protein
MFLWDKCKQSLKAQVSGLGSYEKMCFRAENTIKVLYDVSERKAVAEQFRTNWKVQDHPIDWIYFQRTQ